MMRTRMRIRVRRKHRRATTKTVACLVAGEHIVKVRAIPRIMEMHQEEIDRKGQEETDLLIPVNRVPRMTK